ncbi:MFS transporter [Pseudomonas sp. VI4.1]|uniref:MFS transporter n=1 Tax=Pseudomonas sp. VI4.1 TaxID=1941346 RepID=UPI0009CD24A7|nr:MFS transporter [Pseudomonas sp. VI4.1]OPK10314.1 MFS transporter [Pseudomonas sp. VI4.1]
MNAPQEVAAHKKARKAGIASFIGTTIEWYDFYVYGIAAALVFGKVFFPADLPPGTATMLSFLTLWAGFVARPIGGIIFGHLGDKIGRKTTLVITLVMMGVATTCIGLLPTYLQIGIWAPIALVVLRMIQGIAVGGEWGGAVLIASENAPKGKGIMYAAFAQQGSPSGNLLATLVFFGLSALPVADFMLWGWRIPFLLSAALVIVGMVIRLKLEESDDMKRLMKQKKTVKLPIVEVLRDHWKIVLLSAGVLPIIHVTYFKNTFALSWATKELGYAQSTFLSMLVIALVVQFIVQPFGALLATKIDMRKAVAMMIIPELILMPAMFFAVETKVYWIAVLGMCLATIPHSMFHGAVGGILARAFPTKVRYSGLSISYQLCSLLVGGATPILAQGILNSTGSIIGVAIASASYALVSLVCMLLLLKRIGHTASDLSTAEQADADEFARENLNPSHADEKREDQSSSGLLGTGPTVRTALAPNTSSSF